MKSTANLDYTTTKQRNTSHNAESPSQQKVPDDITGVGGSGPSGEIPDRWESDTANPYRGWDEGHMVNHQGRCGYEIRETAWGKSAEMCGNPVGS